MIITDKKYNVSDKYVSISSTGVADMLVLNGFQIREQKYAKVKNQEKQGFQKHMLRITHPDLQFKGVGGVIPEIVITNSYDGSTSFKIMMGLFRLICANGLVVGTAFGQETVRHIGNSVEENVIAAISKTNGGFLRFNELIKEYSGIVLNDTQKHDFAQNVAMAYKNEDSVPGYTDLLKIRRKEDNANDLFTVLNVIQENIIRYGFRYKALNSNGEVVNNKTRAIKSIDSQIDINRKIFDIAAKLVA